ncbi:DUF1648 domain-containing protein [Streptomyces sp. TLI_55]|uniref:DUF1648 domain-containing protein n=1 Tax=Streptomyces sp. TLI_55 TaxID=1938861 RepID=UPI0015CF7BEE|nr:DUF1648 domain-containing protein [Streptomyces sp. TLI_55]
MSTTHTTPTGLARRVGLVTGPFIGGALVTAIAFLLLQDSFPDKVATHFTLDGTADGYSSPGTALGLYMLVFAIEAVGIIAAAFSAKTALTSTRSLCTFSYGLAAATTYLLIAVMWSASDSDGRTVQLPLYQLPVAVAVGAVIGAAIWLISRRRA